MPVFSGAPILVAVLPIAIVRAASTVAVDTIVRLHHKYENSRARRSTNRMPGSTATNPVPVRYPGSPPLQA